MCSMKKNLPELNIHWACRKDDGDIGDDTDDDDYNIEVDDNKFSIFFNRYLIEKTAICSFGEKSADCH